MARLRQAWRRLGEQQRDFEPPRHNLERVQHQQRLVGWRWHRIRLEVALDGQTGIRLYRAIKLEFSHGPFGGFEPRPSNGQSRDQSTSSRAAFPRSPCHRPLLILMSIRKNCRSNHRTRSRTWSACRSRATPILILGHSIAPRKCSTFSRSCPLHLNDDWNVISRTIIPLVSQPSPFFDSNTNGIGDITQSLFFSPVHPGALIWGVGPVFTVPSAERSYPRDRSISWSARRPC